LFPPRLSVFLCFYYIILVHSFSIYPEDLIAENQRLRMEIEYLRKLDALVQKRLQEEKKKQ